METLLMRARWGAHRLALVLGGGGLVGAALLIASLATLTLDVLPKRAAVQTGRAENERRLAAAKNAPPDATPPPSPQQDLARFRELLATSAGVPQVIATLRQAALDNQLELPEAQLKLIGEQGDPIERYQMVFPIKGEYRQVRGFVHEALEKLPPLGLDELSFRRDDAASAQLDCRVQFTLFMAQGT